jgi:hypothetical protein
VPAARRQVSITSRGTGASEKSRTVRRSATSVRKPAARARMSSSESLSRGGSGTGS